MSKVKSAVTISPDLNPPFLYRFHCVESLWLASGTSMKARTSFTHRKLPAGVTKARGLAFTRDLCLSVGLSCPAPIKFCMPNEDASAFSKGRFIWDSLRTLATSRMKVSQSSLIKAKESLMSRAEVPLNAPLKRLGRKSTKNLRTQNVGKNAT